jgi:hypothetical protein
MPLDAPAVVTGTLAPQYLPTPARSANAGLIELSVNHMLLFWNAKTQCMHRETLRPFGRYAPESGPILLTLRFVDPDPETRLQ